ncbi:MAG: hypothetical protein ABIR05_06510 [Luteimonas sp.]
MNTEGIKIDNTALDAGLRLQLRGLRRDHEPGRDLWPQIAARIAAPVVVSPRHRGGSRFAPWALAASLVLSLGFVWKMQLPSTARDPAIAAPATPSMHREAEAMTREYQAALHELQASNPGMVAAHPAQPGLKALDLGAKQIRTAIAQDPDARFLLDRLHRTYSLRLELTRREFTQRASMS